MALQLVRNWTFNDTLTDAEGGPTLTSTGTISYTDSDTGRAVSLDNASEQLSAGDDADLDFGEDVSFNIEILFRASSITSTTTILTGKKNGLGSGTAGYGFYISSGGRAVRFIIGDGVERAISNPAIFYTDNAWCHMIATVEAGSEIRTYKDGSLVSSAIVEGPMSSIGSLINSENFIITNDSPDNYDIDYIRVYTGRPLTAAEVTARYNGEEITSSSTSVASVHSSLSSSFPASITG